ncbi:hypothetical protein ACSXCH_12830 [Clostridium perfringens]|uniref:Uncharacterized protein n=1 Tax=Clostridium perfringens TaxID=1502 RepID=A0AAW4J4M6_CLOPF|nr:hypothetical protein [Clostridium perfringens]EHP47278.1 hypothetical protein HMPREF9476_02017 [Clostridium perfringens WAL-14572]ELC8368236.1 hypothetical protein [Clostridium perfringens]ELC8386883.1 hypothetical protein [Clostridium perfringens]ELC8407893.1 hypothetical protein [Clostridium perfringens]ELC8420182.1 hypothetical protein [Clostridium perfringens]
MKEWRNPELMILGVKNTETTNPVDEDCEKCECFGHGHGTIPNICDCCDDDDPICPGNPMRS